MPSGVAARSATIADPSKPPTEAAVPGRGGVLELVERTGRFAAVTSRTDLVQRLIQARTRLQDPNVQVVVVGEFKQGKSKLINALVNAPVCPIDDDVATSVPTAVGYGAQPAAWVVTRTDEPEAEPVKVVKQPIQIDDLAEYVSEKGNPRNQRHIEAA